MMSGIIAFIQKAFQSLESGIILPLNKIGYFLAKCAKSNTYVETLGEHADSLHSWIKECYEEDFKRSLEIQVRKAIRLLGVSFPRLAFDTTAEPFYGKTRSLHIFNTPKEEKFGGEFQFITASVITRNKQIPVMALPVRVGEGVAKLAIELLEFCQSLFERIRLALFDRGFYVGELVDYLEAKKIKYLILVPEKRGRIAGYVKQTEELGRFTHEMRYTKEKSSWKPRTHIVICKGIDEFAWIFATNINFRTRVEYIWYYKRRWQIETNYRVEDEARIKSKSANYLIRYFYFLVSLLLHLLWIINKNIKYYVPFKKYLDIIEQALLFDYLELKAT